MKRSGWQRSAIIFSSGGESFAVEWLVSLQRCLTAAIHSYLGVSIFSLEMLCTVSVTRLCKYFLPREIELRHLLYFSLCCAYSPSGSAEPRQSLTQISAWSSHTCFGS